MSPAPRRPYEYSVEVELIEKTEVILLKILLLMAHRRSHTDSFPVDDSEARGVHIVIHASGFPLNDAITQFLHRRLHFAFDCAGDSVRRVVVHLSGGDADRGGIERRCHLQVQLQRLPDVLVEDVQQDLNLAITRAVDRAARTISRRIESSRRLAQDIQAADIAAPGRKRESPGKPSRSGSVDTP